MYIGSVHHIKRVLHSLYYLHGIGTKRKQPKLGRLRNTYGKSTWKAAVSCPRITGSRALFSAFWARFWGFTSRFIENKRKAYRKAYIFPFHTGRSVAGSCWLDSTSELRWEFSFVMKHLCIDWSVEAVGQIRLNQSKDNCAIHLK